MSEALGQVTYLNAGPADVVMPSGKFVLAIRDTRNALGGNAATWLPRVRAFVTNVPGASRVAFLPAPDTFVTDDVRRVAAFYMRFNYDLPPGLNLSQALQQIAPAFADGEIFRVRVLPADASLRTADLNGAIAEAAAEDQKRDDEPNPLIKWWRELLGKIKTAGVFVVVVLVLVLGIAIATRSRAAATAPSGGGT